MTLQCSIQLRAYLAKRRAHMPTEQAAAEAGLQIGEARLHDKAEAEGEYRHIYTTETPHLDFKRLTAPADGKAPLRESVNAGRDEVGDSPAQDAAGAQTQKENDMARGKRKAAEQVEEIKKSDFELAKRIFFNDIKPAKGKVGEHAQEMSTAYKELKNVANVDPQIARLVFKLAETEESKRDHQLRCLSGLLGVFRLYMPRDMVDMAEGKTGDNVIPIGEASRPQLATIPADDSDLAGDPNDWHASLKEGDAVMISVGEPGEEGEVRGTIMFVDGDKLDVEYVDNDETVKASIPRASVSKPDAGDDQQLEAAE